MSSSALFSDDVNVPKMQKILLLGDAGVGKSSIILRYCKNEFSPQHNTTVGATFWNTVAKTEKKEQKLNIWDTSGLLRFQGLLSMYCRNAVVIILVYDMSSLESFERIPALLLGAKKHHKGDSDPSFILVGNKSDVVTNNFEGESKEQVTTSKAKTFAQENSMEFFETSAKSGAGIDDLFNKLVALLPNIEESSSGLKNGAAEPLLRLGDNDASKPSSRCCCY